MGTGKIKLFIIVLMLAAHSKIAAQADYVQYNHPVYSFLERMSTLHIIEGYNGLERPLPRHKVADFIKEVVENKNLLLDVDIEILNDFCTEFEYDIYGTSNNAQNLFSSNKKYSFPSEKESYLYSLTDSSNASIFINFTGRSELIYAKNPSNEKYENASFTKYGGIIRGTFLNKFGFYFKGTNGIVTGSNQVARNINEVNFGYKFNEGSSVVTASNYVDNTEGYITADFDIVNIKFGRDQRVIGFGPVNHILGDNVPLFDQLSLNINYKMFSFSYFHGKILGSETSYTDSIQGRIKNITDKYLAYHRFGFNIDHNLSFGLGEMIIYSGRSVEFSYLNPFNFYKSVEHSNQDRDNSLLFLDVFNNSIKGLKLFGALLIDDIDFGKLGSKWYGNELLYNFTLYSANLYKLVPVDFYIQYLRVDPYVYTHRIFNNNYTNLNYSLAAPVLPNSDMLSIRTSYYPHHKLRFVMDFSFSRHGANEYNPDGSLKRNVGGDVLTGHRDFLDSNEVTFLDGNREYYRSISLASTYETFNNFFFTLLLRNNNNSFYNKHFKDFFLSLALDLRL